MRTSVMRKLPAAVMLAALCASTMPMTVAAGGSPATAAPAFSTPAFSALQPGRTVSYTQRVPINIVFLGFKPDQIDRHTFMRDLPSSSRPAIRDWLAYGLQGRDVGLRYDYDYHVSFAGSNLTDRFFAYLRTSAKLIQPTVFQQAYNDQAHNVLDVTGPVLLDDGPSAEAWLERNLDVPTKAYTLVFINWYGRPDFQFHLYTKNDEPDPDTGFNFGLVQSTGALTAWGGSHGRLWFDDLSAGPDWNTGNWDLDDSDFQNDGIPDYRIPPIWEYTAAGYRSPSKLSSDLGLLARYVGLDELFTSSPYYDPLATAPGVGGSKVVQTNMFEDDPSTQGTDFLKPGAVRSALTDLEPYYNWRTPVIDRNPIDPAALRAWRIVTGNTIGDDCWNAYGTTEAEVYCYFTANAGQYFPSGQANDYVGNVVALNTTNDGLGNLSYLGSADDTFRDGRQSLIQEVQPTYWHAISGYTEMTIHESGHFFAGLSHPHDGLDAPSGRFIDPVNDFEFAWVGDESDTVMSYLFLTTKFGQFDQDNVHRWEMAGYLNWSNGLLGKILAKPGALRYALAMLRADVDARKALDAFSDWDYLTAVTEARKAYVELQIVATHIGVTVPSDKVAALANSTARPNTTRDTVPLPEAFRFPDDPVPFQPFKP